MAVTQQDYLDNSSSVKAARKKLEAAKAALADAKKAKQGLGSVPSSTAKQLSADIDKRIADAQSALDAVVSDVTAAENKAKNYFEKNKEAINAKEAEKEAAKQVAADQAVKDQIAAMKRAGLDTTALENKLASKKKTEEQTQTGTDSGTKTPEAQPEDFPGLLKTSTQFIKDMSGPERKLLAQSLNDSLNLNLPVSELVDPGSLLAAYKGAITAAQARYKQFGDILSVDEFLNQKKLENSAIKSAGGSGTGAGTFGNIYDPTQAKSLISNVITSVLGRDATDKEVAKLTKQLQTAQAKNPYKKNAQGMTIGGLNAEQYITDLVKALPEYVTKTKAKQDLTAQSIESVARANGIKLSQDQLNSYANRVKNGEDIKTIESQIRTTAGLGQPDSVKKLLADGTDLDTIYDPYRRLMATSLGVTPDSITLDDPTLRLAIGPDKEMSLYDYKKAIRQDNRWKYSQEANDEVTNMINQVKRDFGFMG